MKLNIKTKAFISLMRLDKPIGTFLLLWPTLWAIWIAGQGEPPFSILIIFVLGVLVMRSAGCVINDIADRNLDGNVHRTKTRPLVVGAVSTTSALVLFIILCLIAFLLVLQLNLFTIALSSVGLLLAIIYPFTKRVTYLPQLILGITFAWSVPMAFAAVANQVSSTTWLLFGIGGLWPVAYDSIYALMDKEDDLKAGIKSSVILFGKWDIAIIFTLQVLVLGGLCWIGYLLQFNIYFYISIGISLVLLGYQLHLILKRTPNHYYVAFYNNHWLGLIIFIGIVLNYLI